MHAKQQQQRQQNNFPIALNWVYDKNYKLRAYKEEMFLQILPI